MKKLIPHSRQVRRAWWHTAGFGLPVILSNSGKAARRLAIRDRQGRMLAFEKGERP